MSINYEIIDEPSPINFKGMQEKKLTTSTPEIEFNKVVKDFVEKNHPTVYILTPCYGSVCFVNFVTCLMQTTELFRFFNIPLLVEFCRNDSLVTRARNNLIAKAMNNPNTTHMLFIDNDITWNPMDIIKLLISDKSIIGGVYPLKHYNFNRLVKDPTNPYNTNVVQSWIEKKNNSPLKNISDEEIIQHNLLQYNVNYNSSYLEIENNLAKVRHLPTGFMMIRRQTIEDMSRAFPSTKYTDDVHFLVGDENKFAFALFDCGVEDGHYYSEDWLFCHRWAKMGGETWVDVSINLTHTGIEDYRGCYVTSLF